MTDILDKDFKNNCLNYAKRTKEIHERNHENNVRTN